MKYQKNPKSLLVILKIISYFSITVPTLYCMCSFLGWKEERNLKSKCEQLSKKTKVTLVLFHFGTSHLLRPQISIGHRLYFSEDTHKEIRKVILKWSITEEHFSTPTAPQFRSQGTEPLIPNPLHCVEYCVDAALFWLSTQILICEMLIKSEIKGWEKLNMASMCWW